MYVEYITPQRIADPNFTDYKSNGGEYRPTWLIRASDWQKVPGTEATNGYHTLSYCWEQSGEMFQKTDGEFGLIDAGHHQITRQGVGHSITEEVTYDILIQQLCSDFGIDYLWYDKICIDQTNKEEKHREIKQMHLIYSNACYTLALVPEIYIDDPELFERRNWIATKTDAAREALKQMDNSLWWKRSWTLEELMMSTRMLVVGRNTHFWCLAKEKQGNKVKEEDLMSQEYLGFKDRKVKNAANEVLHLAHFRTSSKAHDKIFALANIFNGIISIEINYDANVSATMNTFYRQLARHDLSVMCFGSNSNISGQPRYNSTMLSHNLPSWTGVFGLHVNRTIVEIVLNQNGSYSVDTDMLLHIKCRGYTVRPIKYNDYDVLSDDARSRQARDNCLKKIVISMDDFEDELSALEWSQWCMLVGSNCTPTHYWKQNQLPFCSPILPLSLTEIDEDCIIVEVLYHIAIPISLETDDEGIIISGHLHYYFLPVVKKALEGTIFKAIGLVLLKHFQPNESRDQPDKFLDKVFSNLSCTFNKIVIK